MKDSLSDVIIVGAGIGGLVTGCYLSQAGVKVLVVEKNKQVGGYCRSFVFKNNLRFDSCVHSLASCRIDGTIGKIIEELDLKRFLKINEICPTNIVIFGNKKIKFYRNLDKTISEFVHFFPREAANIKYFFQFVANSNPLVFARLTNKTFCEFLDGLFKDNSLKRIFERIILISTGVLPKHLSAFIGCSTFREYVLDSGYYPVGGMQSFPDALVKGVELSGSVVKCGNKVEEIVLRDGQVEGVVLENSCFLRAPRVVSSCDIYETFVNMIRDEKINQYWESKISSMTPSMSAVCVYLGVEKKIETNLDFQSTVYFLNDSDKEDTEESICNYHKASFLVSCPSFLDKRAFKNLCVPVLALTNVFFNSGEFWAVNKKFIVEKMINTLKANYQDFFNSAILYGIATPQTLYNWTSNYKGAAYGWAGIPGQLGDPDFKIRSDIRGLYLSGHWVTRAHGIISAAYSGKRAAKSILKDF